jgi:serine protease
MNRRSRLLLLGFALLSMLPLSAEETQRYLVASRQGSSPSRLRVASNAVAAPRFRMRTMPNIDAFAANLTQAEVAELQASSDLIVEPILPRYALGIDTPRANENETPVPPAAQETPWGITRIHAPAVWPVTTGQDVNVVVADTGIEATHPDLVHAYKGGFNALEPERLPEDGHRHGTHVAGTIAAANNAVGVVGVAPGVKLWAVKVLADDGEGTQEAIAASLDWTIQKSKELGGRWIVNMSLGSTLYSEIEELAVSNALANGVVIVAAVGNLGTDLVKYPAAYRGVIGVGAIKDTDARAEFSAYGRGLEVMAPGAAVRSSIISGFDYKVGITPLGATESVTGIWRVNGSPFTSFTGRVYDCGIGDPEMFPAEVRGQIALIRRGKWLFREMARHAKNAGAAAMIIETYENDNGGQHVWQFRPTEFDPEWENYEYPLAVGVRFKTGEDILASGLPVTLSYTTNIYGSMNGTSMATPHVTGVVALMLSLAPQLTVSQIEYYLRHTATDLGDAGWDYETGWGVVDALKAAQWVAPDRFGVPPPQPPPPPRRRSVR